MNDERVLILGGSGMLGQRLCHTFSTNTGARVFATNKSNRDLPADIVGKTVETLRDFDATEIQSLKNIIQKIKPTIIINTIVEKNIDDLSKLININSIFPLNLLRCCNELLEDFYLIHISSDGVFSGRLGHYSEFDPPDTTELYGLSKLSGELKYPNCLTIRTSIYGRDCINKRGLLEWFLAQENPIRGYSNVYFSGLSTNFLTGEIVRFSKTKKQYGIVHCAGERISKFELLKLFNSNMGNSKTVIPVDTHEKDTSLVSLILDSKEIKQKELTDLIDFN